MVPSTAQPRLWLLHEDGAFGEDGRGSGNACYSNRAVLADSGNQRLGAERFQRRATEDVPVEDAGLFLKLNSRGIENYEEADKTVYTIGSFNDYQSALDLQIEMKD